jgi:hypothetical protein
VARKKTTKKKVTKRKPSASAASSTTRARKKAPTKKKRKVTKAERKATRPTRRKPQTNHKEVKDYFQREDLALTPKLTAELKLVFCRAYAQRGIIREGTTAAGVSRRTYQRWRKEDEGFNEACMEAKQMAVDILESEAHRRAVEGFDRPVIYKGEVTETYRDYSDSLLSMLMRGNKPEKYKERTEHSGSVGRPMTLDAEDKEDVVASILGMIKNKPDPD